MGSSSSTTSCIAVRDRDLVRDGDAALLTGISRLGKGELIEDGGTESIVDGW